MYQLSMSQTTTEDNSQSLSEWTPLKLSRWLCGSPANLTLPHPRGQRVGRNNFPWVNTIKAVHHHSNRGPCYHEIHLRTTRGPPLPLHTPPHPSAFPLRALGTFNGDLHRQRQRLALEPKQGLRRIGTEQEIYTTSLWSANFLHCHAQTSVLGEHTMRHFIVYHSWDACGF